MAGPAAWDPARPGAAAGLYQSAYTDELAAAIVARLGAGESVSAICRTPGMPDRHTVLNWAAAQPEFGAALEAAASAARVARREVELEIVELRRRRIALGGGKGGRKSSYTKATARAICERLANGETLTRICADPETPAYSTVLKWAREIPEFADMYGQARLQQADWLFDEARDVAQGSTHATVMSDRLRFDVIRWQAAKLAPRKYLEKLIVEGVRAQDAAAQARAARLADAQSRGANVLVCHFRRGPNGEVLCDPPRTEAEEQEWERAYGKPYEGPYGYRAYREANRPGRPKWVRAPEGA